MELLKSLQCMTTFEVPPLHCRFQPGIRLVHKAMPCVASCLVGSRDATGVANDAPPRSPPWTPTLVPASRLFTSDVPRPHLLDTPSTQHHNGRVRDIQSENR